MNRGAGQVHHLRMLHLLDTLERELPALLADRDGWNSLDIDYHPPFVERLYRGWGDHRVSLHRIHPCAPGEALFHPHKWPSAMRILEGTYEMAVGWGRGPAAPPIAARIIASGAFRYEMVDPDAWHFVRPIGGPAMTVMLTGQPWSRDAPRSDRPLKPLDPARVEELFAFFGRAYPPQGG